MKESVYRQCAAAIDRLVKNPPREHGVFTEIDVAMEAATVAGNWERSEFDKSLHDSNEICGQRFRNRKLCRYGPVSIGEGDTKVEDYARIAGKIVYADAETGPDVWETPNGSFKKMMIQDDHLSRQGRKTAAKRNDAEPWSEQSLPAKPRSKPVKSTRSPNGNGDLKPLVKDLLARVKTLEEAEAAREKFIRQQAKRQKVPA